MIGIFDSGSGGLTFLEEAKILLPDYSFLYFWDYKNCPYGAKDEAEIFRLTKLGVEKLRDHGAKIVILACNTATSAAIKKLQKAEAALWIKVLGVTIPWAEKIVAENYRKITVLATNNSVKSKLYKTRVGILDPRVSVQEIALQELVVLVEDYLDGKITKQALQNYLEKKLPYVWEDSQALVLGCTHFSHIKDMFQNYFPEKDIIDPSLEAAKKLQLYLQKHTEIDREIEKKGKIIYID